jgi:hypothetical protein
LSATGAPALVVMTLEVIGPLPIRICSGLIKPRNVDQEK